MQKKPARYWPTSIIPSSPCTPVTGDAESCRCPISHPPARTDRKLLSKSPTVVISAGSLPWERSTLVAPALPLPYLLMSSLAKILVTMMAELTLPSR